MTDLTPKQKRAGLNFANRIARLAASAPDNVAKSALFSVVKWLRSFYGLTDAERRQLVRRSLVIGCSTYDDLVAETQIHRPTLIAIVKEMESAGDVHLRYLERGGLGGRRATFIQLSEKEPS